MSNLALICLFAVLFFAAVKHAETTGYKQGYAAAELAAAQVHNERYDALLTRTSALIDESSHISDLLLKRMQQQTELSRKTTEDLRHALAKTADSRIDCRLPADGMQQLQAARNRAASAVSNPADTSSAESVVPAASGDRP